MDPWAWAILLLVMGIGLAVLEVFFPSGGILGFLTVCSVIASIVVAFKSGPLIGMAILATSVIGLPVAIVAALRYWPKTAMGRRILLITPSGEDVLPDDPRRRLLKSLVGKIGRTKSKMLPSGAISIEGRTIDAVSEGMFIEPGQPVRVTEVRGNRVVVRPVDEDQKPARDEDDPLARPIDSLGLDPFDEEPT